MVHFLPVLEELSSQVMAAVQAMPHDYEEAAQRLLAVHERLAELRRMACEEGDRMAAYAGAA
jgi:hypothetical protein